MATVQPMRSTLTLCGLAASTSCFAQSITSAPAVSVPIPVDHPLALALLAALLGLIAFAVMRKHRVLAAILPVMVAGLLVWQSPDLRAQLLRAFTNPAGETLAIPVQQIPNGSFIAGFEPADYRNDSGVPLVIRAIALPTPQQCFPSGVPSGMLPPTVAPSPPAPCTVGAELALGGVCRVDVDTRCRAISPPVTCYDSTLAGYVDVQYTGVSNVNNNLPRFSSTDGTCGGTALGAAASAYVIVADSLAEADTLCPLPFVGTMASYGYTTAPSNFYLCITAAP